MILQRIWDVEERGLSIQRIKLGAIPSRRQSTSEGFGLEKKVGFQELAASIGIQ